MVAPAAAYSASGRDESAPAPASTSTWWPWAVSSRTPSGVMATRCSPSFVSAGTPTIMGMKLAGGGEGEPRYDLELVAVDGRCAPVQPQVDAGALVTGLGNAAPGVLPAGDRGARRRGAEERHRPRGPGELVGRGPLGRLRRWRRPEASTQTFSGLSENTFGPGPTRPALALT